MRSMAQMRYEIEKGVRDKAVLMERCNSVESEVAREYMRLPLDLNGVPCACGDILVHGDEEFKVDAVSHNVVYSFDKDGARCWHFTEYCTHKPAPTVEDILADFAKRVLNSGHQWGLDQEAVIGEFARKVREVEDAG